MTAEFGSVHPIRTEVEASDAIVLPFPDKIVERREEVTTNRPIEIPVPPEGEQIAYRPHELTPEKHVAMFDEAILRGPDEVSEPVTGFSFRALRERSRHIVQKAAAKLQVGFVSMNEKFHEKRNRNSAIMGVVAGALAVGAVYMAYRYNQPTPKIAHRAMNHLPPGNSKHHVAPRIVPPHNPNALGKLQPGARNRLFRMLGWEHNYIARNHLAKDPAKYSKAVRAFGRGLKYVRSFKPRGVH